MTISVVITLANDSNGGSGARAPERQTFSGDHTDSSPLRGAAGTFVRARAARRRPRSAPPFPRRAPGGAGQQATRAGRRGRRERGRTGGTRPPTARRARLAAPDPERLGRRAQPRARARAPGGLTLHAGSGGGGSAARRPGPPPSAGPPCSARPPLEASAGGGAQRERSRPRSPRPPAARQPAGATFLKGQVAGIGVYLGPPTSPGGLKARPGLGGKGSLPPSSPPTHRLLPPGK